MMKLRNFALYLILASPLALAGCAATTVTATAPATASGKVADAVQAVQAVEISAYKAGQISLAEHQLLESKIGAIAQAGLNYDTALASGNATTTLAQLQAFVGVIAQINPVVLGIKNPNAQAALSAAVLAISATISAL
jgi:hypothetical protein